MHSLGRSGGQLRSGSVAQVGPGEMHGAFPSNVTGRFSLGPVYASLIVMGQADAVR